MTIPTSVFLSLTLNVGTAPAERTDFGALLVVYDHSVTANRQDGPYTSLAEAEAAGFTSTAEPALHLALQKAFTPSNGVESVVVGRKDAGDADWTATLTAVFADDPTSFYFVIIESRADADIQDAYNYVSSYTPGKYLIVQSDDLTMTECLLAQAATIDRVAFVYDASDAVALDASIASRGGGKNLDSIDGQSGWGYMSASGASPATLTSAEGAAIVAAGANYYVRVGGKSFYYPGKSASGLETRAQVSLDWLTDRITAAFFDSIVDGGLDLVNDSDIGIIVGALQQVLDQGVTFSHLTEDGANGRPTISAPKAADLSDASLAAQTLPLTGQCTLAKTLLKVSLVINVVN